ncbi:MAG: SPFH domain-containing protein [Planctomycetota bacterium]|nr:SPFH domain-containing protein [Planctomycetota bacterium]
MGFAVLVLCLVLALVLVGASFGDKARVLAKPMRLAALVLVIFGISMSSIVYVPGDRVGIVTKNMLGSPLKEGKILAVNGEMGPQADILRSGVHLWYWPVLYSVDLVPLIEVSSGQVGLIETTDGLPQDEGQLFAPEWPRTTFQQMLDARYFLTTGKGRKGKQVSVLTPGRYPLNPRLFSVRMVDQTEILQGEVGVLKANFGTPASEAVALPGEQTSGVPPLLLAGPDEMGIRKDVLLPGKYPLNTEAFTLVEIWTTEMVAQFAALPVARIDVMQSASQRQNESGQQKVLHASPMEEREITVRTNDGFTFPVDVRIEYVVSAASAPIVVASLGDDEGDRFRNALNSAVRAIFRNNAEKVKALDYVQQRSQQESQSLQMLVTQMARYGVRVTAVRIGNVGDEETLGALLKTQTDRELAKQEQLTFQEQQKAAEQKKELTRTTQEAEEEKKLATAQYSVKIAAEEQRRRVTEAQAEAEATTIKADAQAEAYEKIALQIGKSNAAMIEVLKIVGERNIQITPRIMVLGEQGQTGAGTALIGTMLDRMLQADDDTPVRQAPKPAPAPGAASPR